MITQQQYFYVDEEDHHVDDDDDHVDDDLDHVQVPHCLFSLSLSLSKNKLEPWSQSTTL